MSPTAVREDRMDSKPQTPAPDDDRSPSAETGAAPGSPRPFNRMREVLTELGRGIVGGLYPPGSTLPTEATLSQQFAIGRNAVREATKILMGKQLVRTGRRAGTIVRPQNEWNLFDTDVVAWRLEDPVQREILFGQMVELRAMIEPEAAASAAVRGTTTQILRIFEAYEEMEAAAGATEASMRADMNFHNRIYEATNNHLLINIANLLSIRLTMNLEYFRDWTAVDGAKPLYRPDLNKAMLARYMLTLPDHLEMAEAIRLRNPDKAREICRHMLAKAPIVKAPKARIGKIAAIRPTKRASLASRATVAPGK